MPFLRPAKKAGSGASLHRAHTHGSQTHVSHTHVSHTHVSHTHVCIHNTTEDDTYTRGTLQKKRTYVFVDNSAKDGSLQETNTCLNKVVVQMCESSCGAELLSLLS